MALFPACSDIFRHRIVEDEQVGARITSDMTRLVDKERYARRNSHAMLALTAPSRDGEAISRPVLTMLIGMLRTISSVSHATVFVGPFLASQKPRSGTRTQELLRVPQNIRLAMEVISEDGVR